MPLVRRRCSSGCSSSGSSINFVKGPAYFVTISFIGLTNGALYALVALGYTLVYGILELINFAHGDVFMLGGMFSATMILSVFGLSAHASTASLVARDRRLAAGRDGGLRGAERGDRASRVPAAARRAEARAADHCDRHVVHPRGRRHRVEGLRLHGRPEHPPDRATSSRSRGITYTWEKLIVVLITVPVLLALVWLVKRTRQGKAMRATAQDRDAAAMMGIDVNRTISFTFLIAGALAGAAGLVYALYFGQIRFDTGFSLGLIAFTAAVLGGIGNLPGAVLGALCIGFIQAFNEGLRWHSPGSDWTQSIVFSILILILVFRPEGLLGERTPEGA